MESVGLSLEDDVVILHLDLGDVAADVVDREALAHVRDLFTTLTMGQGVIKVVCDIAKE